MKATGIVRKVDELGRIVLPIELRRTLDISEKDALEIYVHGSLRYFNHRTNVEISNRLVSFNIKDLGKSLKKFAGILPLRYMIPLYRET